MHPISRVVNTFMARAVPNIYSVANGGCSKVKLTTLSLHNTCCMEETALKYFGLNCFQFGVLSMF